MYISTLKLETNFILINKLACFSQTDTAVSFYYLRARLDRAYPSGAKASQDWERFHKTLIKNVPNKIECFVTLDCKGFLGTSALAYWAHS